MLTDLKAVNLNKDLNSIIVAYNDDEFDYRLDRILGEDETYLSLASGLKKKFDPQGILNPYFFSGG